MMDSTTPANRSGSTIVVLANLGAPEKLEDVRPFLKNLFADPDIFHFPFGQAGQTLFSTLIAHLRAPKSRRYYAAIGGGSPLHENTLHQARKLQDFLGKSFRLIVAQRYWEPFIEDVAATVAAERPEKVVVLPLYPHYSTTTTLSIINEWQRHWQGTAPVKFIERFYDHPLYIRACVQKIREKLPGFATAPHILFSAHAIPVSRVEAGDPYQQEIEDNARLIMEALQEDLPWSVCYQSRVGPVKWLEPTVETEIRRLLEKDTKHFLVFPISFVSEHLETLYELDIQKKEFARQAGAEQFIRANTVGDSADFIAALKDRVLYHD